MGQRLGNVSVMPTLGLALWILGVSMVAGLSPLAAANPDASPLASQSSSQTGQDATLQGQRPPPESPSQRAQRQLVVIKGADYFGHDYDTLQDVGLDDCEAACLADDRCRAFTFNSNAGWCFLKSSFGELRAFDGAVSGYIETGPLETDGQRAQRRSELAFLPSGYRDEADGLRRRIANAEDQSGAGGGLDEILGQAQQALSDNNPRAAAARYRIAVRLAPNDPGLWRRLAEATMAVQTSDWSERQQLQQEATAAAINAYLDATDVAERAGALALIGRSLEARSAWRSAIRAERASLALIDDPALRARLDQLVAEHGFRIIGHDVSSDARNPRICIRFSDPLARDGVELADYLELDEAGLAIEPEAERICIDGVQHGQRYRISVRAGLPANDGERLAKPVVLEVYVRDRSPSVRFPGRAYVLPSGGAAALPVVTVNTARLDAALYRIADRAIGGFLSDETLLTQLSEYQVDEIAETTGQQLWKGEIETRSELNREITTSVPVAELLAELSSDSKASASVGLGPGTYILTARPADALSADELATQWFVVSDLGLTALSADDGLHAFVRSLSSAEPLADVRLQLLALNQQVLGEASTDAQGYARFEPGLLRGAGGNRPALLVAARVNAGAGAGANSGANGGANGGGGAGAGITAGVDYGFLDLKASP
ncbi:PAN/Apple domain-containing protein, partial [Halochromatium sp.]